MRHRKIFVCALCGRAIEDYEEIVKIRPRGRYGKLTLITKLALKRSASMEGT